VEGGETPLLPPPRLEALGFRIAAYPLTLLSVAVRAIGDALAQMSAGEHPAESERISFAALRELVGFDAYDTAAKRYASED
jgi:2-methylisocitrate lyase-like PEP mutase family enzyme